MDGPLDLNKKRVIPEQRKVGTITQLQFLDLQQKMEHSRDKRLAAGKQHKFNPVKREK